MKRYNGLVLGIGVEGEAADFDTYSPSLDLIFATGSIRLREDQGTKLIMYSTVTTKGRIWSSGLDFNAI